MNWILASILMFVSSIIFYLTVKKLQLIGIDKRTISLVNNIFSAILLGSLAYFSGQNLVFPVYILVLIILMRVLLNYLGSISGYKSMELAPNAGYSLVIQKSYAVYTLFGAAILFGSELSLYKFILAGAILTCAAYIGFNKGKNPVSHDPKWALYAVISMLSFGTVALTSKYFSKLGVMPVPLLFWSCVFTSILALSDSWRVNIKFKREDNSTIFYMILLGLSVTGFNYFKLVAELSAPNLGYVGSINAASNAIYAVLVALIFKDTLSKSKFVAIAAMTVGLITLLFS